jgi:4-hydroxybenzoate polyprenyltransferase
MSASAQFSNAEHSPAAGAVLQPENDLSIPLVVDLDDTLLLTDTLYESFVRLLTQDPLVALKSLGALRGGKASFKRRVAQLTTDCEPHLPHRVDLIALLKREKARGRAVHLVTAADQTVADRIAANIDLFDSVVGSDGTRNLKGKRKLAHLQQRFPNGFVYAGDSASDLPVFLGSRGAILCDFGARRTTSLQRAGVPVLERFDRGVSPLRAHLRALRAHQWSKNILLFVPLLVGHAFTDVARIVDAVLAFLILCLVASATYMINDVSDLDTDRSHPTKRKRPFASGDLPVSYALFVAPAMVAAGLLVALALSAGFALALLSYLFLTLAYSLGLKRIPFLDVFVIGVLFALRIVMGTAAIGLPHSPWLLSFSVSFFLSLALAKRHGEVLRASQRTGQEVAGRGYVGDDWPLTLTFGIGTGMVSLVIMLLYVTNDAAPSGFYAHMGWLYAIPPLMLMWLMRIWMLAHRQQLHDDPVVFALKDRASLLLGAGVLTAFILAI